MDPGESTLIFRAIPALFKPDRTDKRTLSEFAATLTEQVSGTRPFTCMVTDDKHLQKLNRKYLQHDYATDVLSFPSGTSDQLGDIAISIERAEEQAALFGHSRLDEIRVLMLHGVLHLLGYDHEQDKGEMARVERKWRKALNLPSNLIARSAKKRA